MNLNLKDLFFGWLLAALLQALILELVLYSMIKLCCSLLSNSGIGERLFFFSSVFIAVEYSKSISQVKWTFFTNSFNFSELVKGSFWSLTYRIYRKDGLYKLKNAENFWYYKTIMAFNHSVWNESLVWKIFLWKWQEILSCILAPAGWVDDQQRCWADRQGRSLSDTDDYCQYTL